MSGPTGLARGWVPTVVPASQVRAGMVLELALADGPTLAMVQWASMYPGHEAAPDKVKLVVQWGVYAATTWEPGMNETVHVLVLRDVLAGEVIPA